MTFSNAITRFILDPLVVALSAWLFAGVNYVSWGQWVATGVALAITGVFMDSTVLDRLGHVGAFIVDVLTATVIVFFVHYALPGSVVTWSGAFATGLLVGVSEIPMHMWVQANRRAGVRAGEP